MCAPARDKTRSRVNLVPMVSQQSTAMHLLATPVFATPVFAAPVLRDLNVQRPTNKRHEWTYRALVMALAMFALGTGHRCNAAQTNQDENDATRSRVGSHVKDFELQDFRGAQCRLSDYADSKVVVLIFSGTECPLAKLYWPTLNTMHEAYFDRSVAFLAINSNAQDSITDLAASVRRSEIAFPVLKDPGNRIADMVGATRTPEVFVLDEERTIRYQGRIDDHFDIGVVRDETRHRYLKDAIDAVLADRAVEVPFEEVVGCLIGRVRRETTSNEVTFTNQISRLLNRHCVECHRPDEIAPFSLTDYEEVAGWSEMILEVIEQRRMPPWHASPEHGKFSNARGLSNEERELIETWVHNGCPEGDLNALPEAPQFATEGWQLEREPDLVVPITRVPVIVPAMGEVEYLYFEVDPGFTEERWIKAAELKPGNRAIVHHILAFAVPPGESVKSMGSGARGFLVGYVPGVRVEPLLPGMAKRIPAHSKLVFQMHYTPIGTPQTDASQLGLIFADPSEVTHEVKSVSAIKTDFSIPPENANYEITAVSDSIAGDTQLLGMMPHMHLRGKSFRYELLKPNREAEILLDIPAYDFNWQTNYRLTEPRKLEANSRIRCVAHYDNSADNLYNPDPSVSVGWGDQTSDEMMIGYFDIAIPIDQANKIFEQRRSPKPPPRRLVEVSTNFLRKHDSNGDDVLELDELPQRFQGRFERVDANGDQKIDLQELIREFARR